jgi:RHH-type proline utilization regulon transcriptional repressor/proline dehydrogenase/delta 1-pyrroline-5-carboxylate dehydrogenase
MASPGVEERTQELGRALLAAAARYRPGPGERLEDWLLTHAVADERFRGRALRTLDALAALDFDRSGRRAHALAVEYLGGEFPGLPAGLRAALRLATSRRLPAPLMGGLARRSAALLARRFITRPGARSIRRASAYLARRGRLPCFDLLGEAVLSDREAEATRERYLALVAELARDPAAGRLSPAGAAVLQISLKLSSLTARFTPLDPAGTARRVREPLEAICEAARRAGVGVTLDLEQHALRDLTWAIFRETFARGERFGAWPHAGFVLQGYLRDAEAHARELVDFARRRGTPFQVRLVKGAYWDYEVLVAREQRWPPAVLTEKGATDAQFERLLELLAAAIPALQLAVGSHNARAHARAEALAERLGLAPGAIEHQTLFRTAEGTSRALARLGWVARDYVPVGELLPGMAYLVRRVLENSSQVGFLLRSRGGVAPEDLLRPPPAELPAAAEPAPQGAGFERAPGARWFEAAFREAFEAALAATRARFGERFPLDLAGAPARGARLVPIRSPSEPDAEPVGWAAFADAEAAERAVEVAQGSPWRATPVAKRAEVLRRAADLAQARAPELAAWIVHEGGRDRADAWAEVEEAIDFLRYYAAEALRLLSEPDPRLAARGVVAVIPPWNFPLSIPTGLCAAALAAGNSAILKPAEQTPLLGHRLARLLHEAGVPDDALLCLPGRGEEVGAALATDSRVAMVAFTGSRQVGVWLHEAVAGVELEGGGVKALLAEMGGKNPILVFADADLDEAVEAVVRSAFGHAGQKCSAASRVLVEAPVAARFRERLVEACRSLRVGRAADPATQVNPVIDREAAARLALAAAAARAEGHLLCDRFDPADPENPLGRGPLVVEIPPERVARTRTGSEELFGPILTLTTFADEEEALRLANASAFGLTAGVFSRSPGTVARAVRRLDAGNVYVNRPITGARVGVEPFGGRRFSGTGPKAGGADTLWAFLRRLDAPVDAPEELAALEAAGRALREGAPPRRLPEGLLESWGAPLAARLAAVERAAGVLARRADPAADALAESARAAREELARPQRSLPVAGQRTELWYETPRGLGLLFLAGPRAGAWLGAALLAGNACLACGGEALAEAVPALREAGVPGEVLRGWQEGEGLAALLALAADPRVSFAAIDRGPALARALAARLGPTAPGQRGLKALLSPLEGPQPGEAGFLLRFAWPKLVAVRTLRHGTELELGA